MHAQNIYALVIACMSARKKLQVVKLVLIPYCWSVALEKERKKKLLNEQTTLQLKGYASGNRHCLAGFPKILYEAVLLVIRCAMSERGTGMGEFHSQ